MKKNLKDIYVFGIIFIIADQMLKIILSNKMIVNQNFIVIKNFFSIRLVHNTGAAFSILSNSRLLLTSIGILALIGLIFYIKSLDAIDDIDTFVYALLFGGIVGNLIDRIIYGYVIDYISFQFGSYYFPIFNFADICIVLAVIIILIRTVKESLWK